MSNQELAASSQVKKLRYVENLYGHADRLFGSHALDDALGNLNDVVLADILESWFISIRNQPSVGQADEARWRAGLAFVVSVVTWLSKTTLPIDRLRQIEARLHRLSHLYGQATRHPEMKPVRRIIWSFTRDPVTGLPASTLVADTQWQPQLLANIRALMARLQEDHGLEPVPNLGSRLAKTELTNAPLHAGADLATGQHANLRIHTVHKVKGETLDAVLYLAEKDHAEALLRGAETELGRIGYVAVTRARNLVWLGVPSTALDALRPALVARGFSEVGVA